MKKIILVALASLVINSLPAFAEEQMITIDGKQIVITEIDKMFGSSERKIDAKLLQGGIYVIAEAEIGGNRLPNAEALIKEQFAAAGIPISDTLESSAAAITFWANGSLNLARADQRYAQGMNANKISSGIAAAAGSMVANGVAGGAGALIGLFIPQDEKTIITGLVREKPFMNKGLFGSSLRSSVKDGEYGDQIEIQYSLPKEEEKQATQDVILKMAVDQWIKRYISQ